MPFAFRPLLFLATCAITQIASAQAPVTTLQRPEPPVPPPATRPSAELDAQTLILRQSLFKTKPRLTIAAPSAMPATPAPGRIQQPPAKPVLRNSIAIILRPEPKMPPAPVGRRREIPPAVRELSLQPASFTPYDRHFGIVRSVIAGTDGGDASMGQACRLMEQCRLFRYVVSDPYRPNPPAETAERRSGDCKSKALWLYEKLGDPAALYVVGKQERRSKTSHAWVLWRSQGRWWILDPTTHSSPITAASVARNRYVPYYSFGKGGAYRHPATRILLAEERRGTLVPAVATRGVSKRENVR